MQLYIFDKHAYLFNMRKIARYVTYIVIANLLFSSIPAFAENPIQPSITSVSPSTITPQITTVIIDGVGFGAEYIPGSTKVCFGNKCIGDEYIDKYLKVWSDTEVQVLVPWFVTSDDKIALVVYQPSTGTYGPIFSATNYSVVLPQEPSITSISPDILVPDDTVVTINGVGFGDTYEPQYHQICFGINCIPNEDINNYLQYWSDTQIILKTPPFVTEPSGKIALRVYMPSKVAYDFIESAPYATKSKPFIQTYFTPLDQGRSYTFTGTDFGASTGVVAISGVQAEVISWSDTEITFKVPLNIQSGKIYFQRSDGIKSQEINVEISGNVAYSNDEFSSMQWGLGKINILQAWTITEGSSDVTVAIVDSGVDINHEELRDSIWTNGGEISGNGIDDDNNGYIDDVHGWDFVLNSNSMSPHGPHGTMVASVIAAKKDNGIGIAGIAPNVKIMPLNIVEADQESISVDAGVKAIKYAVDNGADIINLSFGGYGSSTYYEEIIKYAYDNNVLVVAAEGNDSKDTDVYPYSPASMDLGKNAVLGVAATDDNDLKSSFSNYGTKYTDLSAPGSKIVMAMPTSYGYYTSGDGTSFSSPIVAGIAALVKSENPTWNVEEIKNVLLSSAKNIDTFNPQYTNKLGRGLPDAYAAITFGKPTVTYIYAPRENVQITETGASTVIEIPVTKPIETPITKEIEIKSDDTDGAETKPTTGPVAVTTPPQTETKTHPFSDTAGYEYEDAIRWLLDNGIVEGYSDGTYQPYAEINRAEFTKIIIGGFNYTVSHMSDCFPDVGQEWFAQYVCTAKADGIINGNADGKFKPGNLINTVEAVKIILNTAISGLTLQSTEGEPWYMPYVNYATNTNIAFIFFTNTYDHRITRGEMAEMIYQMRKPQHN